MANKIELIGLVDCLDAIAHYLCWIDLMSLTVANPRVKGYIFPLKYDAKERIWQVWRKVTLKLKGNSECYFRVFSIAMSTRRKMA